jgi:hypothetical protein
VAFAKTVKGQLRLLLYVGFPGSDLTSRFKQRPSEDIPEKEADHRISTLLYAVEQAAHLLQCVSRLHRGEELGSVLALLAGAVAAALASAEGHMC